MPLSSYPLARIFLPIVSVLALLTMVVTAPASADSSGAQYEDVTPTACGDAPCENGGLTDKSGKGDSQKGKVSNSPDDESSNSGEGLNGAGDDDGAGSKSKAGHADEKANGKSGDKSNGQEKSSGTQMPDDSGDDGSSPLVPILIVFAVLAAISVGVVIYRRKHQPSPDDDDTGA